MNHFVRLLLACLLPLGFAAESTAALRVSLLTCAPGREVYQLEGHTALRLIETPDSITQNDYDIVVNWGVFDFTTPNFVYRFVKGATDYMAVAIPPNCSWRSTAASTGASPSRSSTSPPCRPNG